MDVVLRGSMPGATTAGILLLTRARQLGLPLQVSVIGDPEASTPIPGPAVLYAPVLASCGVGREEGAGGLVIVPGAPRDPLMMTATPHGVGGWFLVDRSGSGHHPATQAFVRLSRDPRVPARHLAKDVRRAMEVLGMAPEPAVLDVLFSADVPPLTRLSLALRAGRALSGGRGEPITRFMSGHLGDDKDPLPSTFDAGATLAAMEGNEWQWIIDELSPAIRDRAEAWLAEAAKLARDDDNRDLALVHALAELASHLVQLPPYSILPPLGAAEDSVSVGLKAALSVSEARDALRQLIAMYRFLGGRYTTDDEPTMVVCNDTPPEDKIGRWQWFCTQVRTARKQADEKWPTIHNPAN